MSEQLPSKQRVRLLKDIYDDGEDHHPPGYCAHKGEVVEVRSLYTIGVAHQGITDSEFVVRNGEFEIVTEPLEQPSSNRHVKCLRDLYRTHPIVMEAAGEIERLQQDVNRYENGRVILLNEIDALKQKLIAAEQLAVRQGNEIRTLQRACRDKAERQQL